MKLPNGQAAIVELVKLTEYCLNPLHPVGRHKARVFHSALGLGVPNAEELREALKNAAETSDALLGVTDQFGRRFILDFEMNRAGKTATIRSCWMVRAGEETPRSLTCYVR